jgi:hypothetical protein
MVVNRLQDGSLNSHIALRVSRLNCQKKKVFKWEHILFFRNTDRDFYSEINNVSQVPCEQQVLIELAINSGDFMSCSNEKTILLIKDYKNQEV